MGLFDFLTKKDEKKSSILGGVFDKPTTEKVDLPGINRLFTPEEEKQYNPQAVKKAVDNLPPKHDFFKDVNEGVSNFTKKLYDPGLSPEVVKAVNSLPDLYIKRPPGTESQMPQMRRQTFGDVANFFPQLLGDIISLGLYFGKTAKEGITGKESKRTTVPALFGKDQNYIDAQGAVKGYMDAVRAGIPEDEAYRSAAKEGIVNAVMIAPIIVDGVKFGAKKAIPEKLINPEVIQTSKADVFDYLSGRKSAMDLKLPKAAQEQIAEVMKNGTREEKLKMLQGIDVLSVKPSRLGKLLGIDQAQAELIMSELHGTPVRPSATGALPGYRERPGQGPAAGLSIRETEGVGFEGKKPKITPEELNSLAEETKRKGKIVPEEPIEKSAITPTNEDVTKKIHELRGELETAQSNLDKAIGDQELFGDEIPDLQSKVNDLRKQIKDIKYPAVATAKEVLAKAEKRVKVEPTKIEQPEEDTGLTEAEQEEINNEYTKVVEQEGKDIADEVKAIRESKLKKDEKQNEIDELKLQNELSQEIMKDMPGKKLQKFISRREGEFLDLKDPNKARTPKERQAIMERTKKVLRASEAAFEATGQGTDTYDDPDTIRDVIAQYRIRRKEFLEQKYVISQKVKNFREKQNIIEAVEKEIRAEGRSRMHQIQVIKDFFVLTDKELKQTMKGNPDVRLLTDEKFNDLLKGIEGKAYAISKHREALLAVESTIFTKELRKVENLRKALKMKEYRNMSINELDKFNALLESFQTGDEFLGPRQIQTAKLTDLGEIKTRREALEALAKEAGVPFETVQQVKVKTIDKFLYDVAFARQNPLYKIMVENANHATIEAGKRFYEIKNVAEKLMREARKSRPRRFVDKLVPTDQMIFDYLSGDPLTKIEIAKRMTPEEIKASLYIQQQYSIMRDYLVNQGTLEKYRQNYITHIRRSFLEMLKETGKGVFTKTGIKGIFKELMDVNKLQRANFNILNDKTGEVLPLEKFFKFSMQRSGNLIPTKNVAKAFLNYVRTFETKRELDSFIPKIDIFSHVLTPSEMTKRGLVKNDTLRVFVRKWLNTKKGRIVDTGFVSPGDKIDLALRSGIAATRLIDLGLNIPVGLASNLGAQSSTFIPLGVRKYGTGVRRSLTKKGTEIAHKYEFLVGESLWERLRDASKDLGDKTNEVIFGLYGDADRRAKKVFLLGKMTPAEFKSGELSSERLAQLRNEMGRFHIMDGMSSIIGKTSPGMVFTQYKSWAVPMMHTNLSNLAKFKDDVKAGKNPFKSQESKELLRSTLLVTSLLLLGYKEYSNLRDTKNRSFLQQLAYKAMNDALSIIGALDPTVWGSPTRLQKFIGDLLGSMTTIATSLATGERSASDEVPGVKEFTNTVEPKAFQQLLGDKTETSEEKVTTSLEKSLKNIQDKIDKVDPNVLDRVEKIHAQAKELGFGTPEADALVSEDNLSDDDYEVYKLMRSKDAKEAQIELVPKVLPIFEQASELGFGTPEADKLVEDLTDDEYDVYKAMKKSLFAQPEVGPSKWDQQSFLDHVSNIAKGWTISPVTAFDNLVHGDWKITQLKNGQIIVDRMPVDASQEVKAKVAKDNADFKLDHVIPLEAGGTNRTDNLQIITTKEWADNTQVENYLGKALGDKKITGAQAREYAIRFKAGQEEVLTPKLLEEYKEKYDSVPITFEEIKSLTN